MIFKNLYLYRLARPYQIDPAILVEQLGFNSLQPCGKHEPRSIGWVSPRSNDQLVHVVNSQMLITLGIEQKLLPASVVKAEAKARADLILHEEGRRVGRREMRDLREAAAVELLSKAFVCQRTTMGWIDPVNGWLVVDASTAAKAEEFLEHLRRSVDGFKAMLVHVNRSPTLAMTGWIMDGDAPENFTVDHDLELRSAERSEVKYIRHTLDGDEIRNYVTQGMVVTKMALTWCDRISFVLTENLQIKRLCFLEILKEEAGSQAESEEDRFDIDFALMTGELSKMLDDIVVAHGGERAEV